MSRNLEWKARLPDLAAARQIATRLATANDGNERQVDTYFRVPTGRLKLREIESATGSHAELIFYQRFDTAATKTSHYLRQPLEQTEVWKELFTQSLGILTQVVKTREIWWHDNVRIHLDQVANLGDYLEFEAVLQPEDDPLEAEIVLQFLMRLFALDPTSGIAVSYSDLLLSSLSVDTAPKG